MTVTKFPIFWHNSETGMHISAESATDCDLAQTRKVLAPLTRTGSFIGVLIDPLNVVQLIKQSDGTWWLERLNSSSHSGTGTHVNVAMAEQVLEHLFEGDLALNKFCTEFPFLKWRRVDAK